MVKGRQKFMLDEMAVCTCMRSWYQRKLYWLRNVSSLRYTVKVILAPIIMDVYLGVNDVPCTLMCVH